MSHAPLPIFVFTSVTAGDSEHNDAKMKLAELYEAMNEPRKALNLVYEGDSVSAAFQFFFKPFHLVIEARKRHLTREGQSEGAATDHTQPSESLFQEKAARGKAKKTKRGMTLAQLQELELEHEASTKRGFESLKKLAPDMKRGKPEAEAAWLLEAETLVESFREVKPLFPSTRVRPKHLMLGECDIDPWC